MAELLRIIEHVSGTAPLVGASAELLTFLESSAGTVSILGQSAESLLFSENTTGVVSLLGRSNEALRFKESTTGSIIIVGTSAEAMKPFAEKAIAALWGRESGSLSFAERVTGTAPIIGVSSASLSFSEHLYGTIIEAVAGVWCINLATGGHSRYEGSLDGSTPVAAYAVLPSNQLGSDRAKYVPEIYLHMRTNGEVEVTTLTDEQIERCGYTISDDGRPGLHRRRRKLAGGIKGTNWGFKIANVSGSSFSIKSAEPMPVASRRVR